MPVHEETGHGTEQTEIPRMTALLTLRLPLRRILASQFLDTGSRAPKPGAVARRSAPPEDPTSAMNNPATRKSPAF